MTLHPKVIPPVFLAVLALFLWVNAPPEAGEVRVSMLATAYCGCSECCSWERGNWKFLKLDQWNRYVASGPRAGRPYDGRTASGDRPREPQPGLFSLDTLQRPWMAPPRLLFPWKIPSRMGTIAADTEFYPIGTVMYVPGYGWGTVQDRGSAIKGPNRIDVFMKSHSEALEWGRREVKVVVQEPSTD